MKTTRRTYTAEFKIEAVKMMTVQGLSCAEVARQLDINENVLRKWKLAYQAGTLQPFPGQGQRSPEVTELERLRTENQRLRAERDLLKKATAFFASRSS